MKLDPQKDFYYEDGKMVLTAHYLRNRGHCCGNFCRHCPYVLKPQEKPQTEKVTESRKDVPERHEN